MQVRIVFVAIVYYIYDNCTSIIVYRGNWKSKNE